MKTLLTEKQIYKLHKGDNISARTVMEVGKFVKQGWNKYLECIDKIVFRINKCPHCGSTNSFHKRQQDVYSEKFLHYCSNVYKTKTIKSTTGRAYIKIDVCLDCHKEFFIEMFLYKKYNLREYLKRRLS